MCSRILAGPTQLHYADSTLFQSDQRRVCKERASEIVVLRVSENVQPEYLEAGKVCNLCVSLAQRGRAN